MSMALGYATAPRLAAHLRRQSPPIEVPEFDVYSPLRMNRLVWLLLTVRLPKDRPRLSRLLVATRVAYASGPLLMIAAMAVAMTLPAPPHPRSDGGVSDVVLIPGEPAR